MSEAQDATAAERRQINDFVCTACGCTCDDLRLTVQGRRIVAFEPPCPLAETFLLQDVEPPTAACLVNGRPAELEAAIERAAEILQAATAPLVMGFERATIEAQRFAVEIADRLGGYLDPAGEHGQSRSHLAVQTAGAVTATLGEVAARSDLVIYWNVDPATTHPRHLERFARRPRTVRDAEQTTRRVITVATTRTKTAQVSDEQLTLRSDGEIATLALLRALIRGIPIDPVDTEAQAGAPLEQWAYLAQRLKMAKYAAIFYEPQAMAPSDPDATSQAVTELVRELHRYTRAVALRLGAACNAAGAAQVLTWQSGFPTAVSFAAGYPQYLPGEATARLLLERGEADAALVIGADPLPHWPKEAADRLASIPTIVIDDRPSATSRSAQVAIFTARFGIESTGSVYRSDGVSLPLRPAITPQLSEAETVLRLLSKRVHSKVPQSSSDPLPLMGRAREG